MNDRCPICGKGAFEDGIYGLPVSHRTCVEKLEDQRLQLKADVADAIRLLEQAEAEMERLKWMLHQMWTECETEFPAEVCEGDYEGYVADLARRYEETHQSVKCSRCGEQMSGPEIAVHRCGETP